MTTKIDTTLITRSGLLNGLELVRNGEDEDQPGIRIGARLQRVGDVQPARKPVDERPQVERHVPALGRDAPRPSRP